MNSSSSPVSFDLFSAAASILLSEFPLDCFAVPDPEIKWRENPFSIPGRVCNDILFALKTGPEKTRRRLLRDMFSFLEAKRNHPGSAFNEELNRISEAGENTFPDARIFLTGLRSVCARLYFECLEYLAEKEVKDWDRPAKNLKVSACSKLLDIQVTPSPQKPAVSLSPYLKNMAHRAAEEESIFYAFEYHFEKAAAGNPEEQYAFIIEKMRPPMGVVTHTSPALLRPCAYILPDERIPASSGIPYNAALILSILQDSRCTKACLQALEKWPPRYTKIRENLIYTLGMLGVDAAVPHLTASLQHSDQYMESPDKEKGGYSVLLQEQKEEAIQALGRIGEASLKALPELCSYSGHSSIILPTTLAWTLGELGQAQKNRFGGVGADILITMLKLLQSKNKQIFEEAVAALKKIGMPEFIHSLYLYNVGAVNILGLKPAQRGLYELSETLHYLIRTQGQAVIAVNGDSGTGKTYFCHALQEGFGNISTREILYLMRDRTQDQKIFNRMLGLKWLRKYIEPSYYQGYPLSEEEDDPDAFFQQFFSSQAEKKLIILDGCRDRHYFQRVIDLFYFHGKLDCEVNFRATHSTRRRNLEEREIALESVKNHLAFREEPALEDTHFYREGFLKLYDLDNSLGSRLNREEIHELFGKSRIEEWGDLIRLGDFTGQSSSLPVSVKSLSPKQKNADTRAKAFPDSETQTFSAAERKFTPCLNPSLDRDPHLLLSVDMDDLKPRSLRFYALEQIAGTGSTGKVFVLSFIDNRIFYSHPGPITYHPPVLVGRDLFLIAENGNIHRISFERGEYEKFNSVHSPVYSASVYLRDMIVTGHKDGSISIWDFNKKNLHTHPGHNGAVYAVTCDHYGRIYSWGEDGLLIRRHPELPEQQILPQTSGSAFRLKMIPWDRLLIYSAGSQPPPELKILDFTRNTELHTTLKTKRPLQQTCVDHQSRIIMALGHHPEETSGSLAVIEPGPQKSQCHFLNGHSRETHDCLVMGPRILTCGRDDGGRTSLRIWGTPFFVQREHAKLSL